MWMLDECYMISGLWNFIGGCYRILGLVGRIEVVLLIKIRWRQSRMLIEGAVGGDLLVHVCCDFGVY